MRTQAAGKGPGQGNDILEGSAGADTFVFRATDRKDIFGNTIDSGFDRITDFYRAHGDRIDLSGHFEATDYATFRVEANQLAGDTHLRLGVGTIVIEDVTISELRSDMFLF